MSFWQRCVCGRLLGFAEADRAGGHRNGVPLVGGVVPG
ncbi:hypothetical protein FTUN_8965 [Frigoriglobus tundricola]|uniref:Uncharacterized protein n=1 Tax=Frigoriglobus tundricola TaxID=2774151 RepID=A0A6M5Z7J5_9BACT|nr:hypothetical protein FTUN_8965 [Frigoriglobus tundricola]